MLGKTTFLKLLNQYQNWDKYTPAQQAELKEKTIRHSLTEEDEKNLPRIIQAATDALHVDSEVLRAIGNQIPADYSFHFALYLSLGNFCLSIPRITRFFILTGLDMNYKSTHHATEGFTPLHFVCGNDLATPELIRYMIELGADPHIKNKYDETPLEFLVRKILNLKIPPEKTGKINIKIE